MTPYLYLHTLTILFLLSFNVFGTMHNHSAKIIVHGRGCPATPGQSRSRQNFTDSNSDSRENGRLRLTPSLVSTPTPQPCLQGIVNKVIIHLTLAWGRLHYSQATHEANGCFHHGDEINFISKLLYINGSETVVRNSRWGYGATLRDNDGPRKLMTTSSILRALIILSGFKHH